MELFAELGLGDNKSSWINQPQTMTNQSVVFNPTTGGFSAFSNVIPVIAGNADRVERARGSTGQLHETGYVLLHQVGAARVGLIVTLHHLQRVAALVRIGAEASPTGGVPAAVTDVLAIRVLEDGRAVLPNARELPRLVLLRRRPSATARAAGAPGARGGRPGRRAHERPAARAVRDRGVRTRCVGESKTEYVHRVCKKCAKHIKPGHT